MKKVLFLVIPFQLFLVSCNNGKSFINSKETKVDTVEVVNWIAENAIPITDVDPLSATVELKALYPIFETKRIVALGDGTHGTRDFFKLKHKIIKQLVSDLGYTAIAMEFPLDFGVGINKYVKTGEGNIDELMQRSWWWHQSEEIKDFFIWMHDYNKDLPDNKKISFYGFDSQVQRRSNTEKIFQYLEKVDTSYNESVKPILDFMGEFDTENYGVFTPYRIGEFNNAIEKMYNLMETNKGLFIANSSKEEFLITKARLNSYKAYIGMQNSGGGAYTKFKIRDAANAENIEAILDIEGENSKIVLWAHNGHLTTDKYIMQEFFDLTATEGFYDINLVSKESITGYLLKEKFGDLYFNIGFEFFAGSFTAIEYGKGFKTFTLDDPEESSLPFLFNQADVKTNQYLLLLDQQKMNRSAKKYFNSIQTFQEIGAAYITRYSKRIPSKSYDAILFFKQTSGSTLLQ